MEFTPFISSWIKFWATETDRKVYRNILVVLLLLGFSIAANACVVSCKISLSVSLDQNGEAILTPLILLQDPSCDPNDFTVNITDPSGNSVGNTLNCNHLGLTMTATVTQTATGNSCATTIYVFDNLRPQIQCVDTTVLCIQSTDPESIGYPVVSDNCTMLSNADLTYEDEFTDLPCYAILDNDTITAQIQRTWSVSDAQGNEQTCVQMIYLRRATIDLVDFPQHLDGFVGDALDCSTDPTDLNITGEPTIDGERIDIGGHCELVVSHTDQTIPICGPGGYKILRTWTVIDYCSNTFTLSVQVIKIEDTTPPVLQSPADITVGTGANSCEATVTLPLATATDDCSDLSIEATWDYGTGEGPFSGVALGTHTVIYTATDACGNSSEETINVTVVDDIAPTPICNALIEVNLGFNGEANALAASFDSGSHDNCGIDSVLVSRDGINFNPSISFDCSDVSSTPIPVHLRITDLAGNVNGCTVYARVDDKINPAMTCPPTANLSCSDDIYDLAIVGQPLVNDNCGIDTLYYSDQANLNDCNEGTITRIWTVADERGNESSCVQLINLTDNTPLQVIFPIDYMVATCGASTETSITGEPTFINDDCEQTSFTHTDQIVTTSASCYRILRTWKVYEWCIYDPNGSTNAGFWTDIQIIDVIDEDAPVLTCPADITVDMFAADCAGAAVNLLPLQATDCNPTLNFLNDSPYASSNGADASGTYPPGTHTVNFYVNDGCNNSSSCSVQITVVDAKKPTVICSGGVNVSLMESGTVTITPDLIDYGSFDNCTASSNLIRTVSTSIFTCDELGEQTITLTITDEAGNSDNCSTIINIQDNNLVCVNSSHAVSGTILTENGTPLESVELFLSGGIEDTLMCDVTGYFNFPEVPAGDSYEVTPHKNTFHKNGVSTFDLIYIQRHVLNIQYLDSPYKIIAADVNKSGGITGFDIVQMRKLILQIDTVYSNNTSWRFVDASYAFADPTQPLGESFPESITIAHLEADQNNLEFIGIKIGDVNGNANPAQFGGVVEARNEKEPLRLKIEDELLESGEHYRIPIRMTEARTLMGYQFTLDFDRDALQLLKIEAGDLPDLTADNFGWTFEQEGAITANWASIREVEIEAEAVLFYLQVKTKKAGQIGDLLKINSRFLQAEAYNDAFEIVDVILEANRVGEKQEIASKLGQNSPNPMVEQTTIDLYMAEMGVARLVLLSADGRIVRVMEQEWATGAHQVVLQRSDFPSAGVYFYQFQWPDGRVEVKKMMVQ